MSAIVCIATAAAPYTFSLDETAQWMERVFENKNAFRKLNFILRESGIKQKYSVLPDFSIHHRQKGLFDEEKLPFRNPGTAERMKIYAEESVKLAREAAEKCLRQSETEREKITHIITVTCTGLTAPGLEVILSNELKLQPNTQRSAINFMGCYAAFHALKQADLICRLNPENKVLIVCVELCTLHFSNNPDNDNLLSTTLFSDGAAAALVTGHNGGNNTGGYMQLSDFYSTLIPEGEKDMAWTLGEHGFEMYLNNKVPGHIELNIEKAYRNGLLQKGIAKDEIDFYAIHPGGKNILKAFGSGIGLQEENLKHSYGILQKYGNMSSPSVLFVLEAIWREFNDTEQDQAWIYTAAFGPGLTVESGLFSLIR